MSNTTYNFRKFDRVNNAECSFSVSDSIEEALSIFISSIKNHDIHVDFEYRGLQMVYGFPTVFSQIILHILINVRETFDTNNISNRKLKIQISNDKDFIVVEFTDNAGGIDPALISKLSEPYFTTKEHGTGNGLYITKLYIEKMNGFFKVQNTEDGSRFILSVPKVLS
ncbi:signal transduction histidine kinase [Neobacillus niacini]|jgi:signal transduction histidine kinase|uniref:sensor histidine kinase n=1 Tax=Neobacillus niacini TaxID=86668 RepID=UPI00277E4A28|nr:HAMP domain-containing sensor histidine kinase [Neobacillus niacini]MDQ1002392.1 signal transduction histidine kinase [Neobacillus niacini]